MKQSLQLKLGQHLTMTPQLQQAIRLLQLSALELSAEIQDALDSNMMLELAEGEEEYEDAGFEAGDNGVDEGEFAATFEVGGGDPAEAEVRTTTEEIPDDLPVDSNWEEIYDSLPTSSALTRDG